MAKKQAKGAAPAAGAAAKSSVARKRRNALERKCLSKAAKRLYRNCPPAVFRMLEQVKRVKVNPMMDGAG